MRNSNFQNKQQYLDYRAAWKAEYAALSQTIRDLKLCRKSLASIAVLGQMDRYERTKKAHATAYGFSPTFLAWHYRSQARAMLDELKKAKLEAQRQYLSQRNQEALNPSKAS